MIERILTSLSHLKTRVSTDFSLVPEPYKSWLKGNPSILEGKYSPENIQERDSKREIQAIREYFNWLFTSFPEYESLLQAILQNPISESNEPGLAGVTEIGRRMLYPMHPECRVAVVMPAKDEEDNIYRTLESYAQQKDIHGNPLNPNLWEINVLINTSEVEEFDGTWEEIMKFKSRYPEIHINVLEVKFQKRWARIGMVRKLATDITLYRALLREHNYTQPLYIQSEDADLVWVDPRQITTVINTFDSNPKLDVLVGYQEKFLRLIANVELAFLHYRFWDIATAQVAHYILKGKIPYEKRDFHWSRPFTYGTNTAFTAEVYALIGGYDWDAIVGEDLDIGKRVSLLRGRLKEGKFIPELSTIGRIRTRTNSSPRRYLWSLMRENGNPYSDENFQNPEARKLTLEEIIKNIPDRYKRLTEDTKRFFEKELWFLYESLRKMVPDQHLAKLIATRTLILMGFCPGDFEITDDEIHILNVSNFSRALEEYRKRKGIKIST